MNQALVDSNVLQYGVKSEYASDVGEVLARLEAGGFKPGVLAYTTFEVYRGLIRDRVPSMRALVGAFSEVAVDNTSFKLAAMLTSCYKEGAATKNHYSRYSDGDVVLGACAFRYNTYILTANGNDFPRPFFAEARSFTIKSRRTRVGITVNLLRPEYGVFQSAINEVYSSAPGHSPR